jgi:hypothetical protein
MTPFIVKRKFPFRVTAQRSQRLRVTEVEVRDYRGKLRQMQMLGDALRGPFEKADQLVSSRAAG